MATVIHFPRGTWVLLRTDGRQELMPEKPSIPRFIVALGYTTFDTVLIGRTSGTDLVMFVDDLGWESEAIDFGDGRIELRPTKARHPVNPTATALYHAICKPGTTHEIVGNVAIAHDGDFA